MKIKKFAFILLIFLFLFPLFSKTQASVHTLSVDCSSGCIKSGTDPLFSLANDGYWYPGQTITKIINLKNSDTQAKEMDIKPSRTSLSSDLEDVINIEISNATTNTIVWSGTLKDFYNQSKINMGVVNSGDDLNYFFKVSMDSDSGNDYQGLESVFDLTLGFWTEDVSENSSNPGGPGDGLSDGKSDGKSSGGTPAPAVLGTAVSAVNEFFDNILGEETEANEISLTPAQEEIKDVLGKQTDAYCSSCLWWPVILAEIIALAVYYWLVFNKKPGQSYLKRRFVWGLAIPVVTYIIFLILNKGCSTGYLFVLSDNFFCKWFWLFNLGVYVAISYFWKRYFLNKNS